MRKGRGAPCVSQAPMKLGSAHELVFVSGRCVRVSVDVCSFVTFQVSRERERDNRRE